MTDYLELRESIEDMPIPFLLTDKANELLNEEDQRG